MLFRLRLIFVWLVFLFVLSALGAQSNERALPDTSTVKTNSESILKLLHDNAWLSSDWIAWEDFVLNGTNLGSGYLESFDNYEEDYFMEDTIKKISGLLKYEGSDRDTYSRYTATNKDNSVIVKTSNKRKSITMILKPSAGKSQLLYSITITDKK